MAVYLNENEENLRNEELKKYDEEIQRQIDEDNVNARARRKKQDKVFQKFLLTAILVVIILMVITWAR